MNKEWWYHETSDFALAGKCVPWVDRKIEYYHLRRCAVRFRKGIITATFCFAIQLRGRYPPPSLKSGSLCLIFFSVNTSCITSTFPWRYGEGVGQFGKKAKFSPVLPRFLGLIKIVASSNRFPQKFPQWTIAVSGYIDTHWFTAYLYETPRPVGLWLIVITKTWSSSEQSAVIKSSRKTNPTVNFLFRSKNFPISQDICWHQEGIQRRCYMDWTHFKMKLSISQQRWNRCCRAARCGFAGYTLWKLVQNATGQIGWQSVSLSWNSCGYCQLAVKTYLDRCTLFCPDNSVICCSYLENYSLSRGFNGAQHY